MNRKRIVSYNDKLRVCKSPSKKSKPNEQRVDQKTNVIQLWPENEHELEQENKKQSRNSFRRRADYSLQDTTPNVQLLEVYDDCESLMKTENNIPCEKNPLKNVGPHTSSGSDQRYRKDRSIGHKQAREPKVRYHCTECGKTCLWMSSLIMHQRIHTGERPFHCTICGKRFTQKGDLRRHQQVHTGARPYKCNICNKTFTQKWHLLKHERSHLIIQMY